MKNFEWGVPESAMKWPIMEEKKVSIHLIFYRPIKKMFRVESCFLRVFSLNSKLVPAGESIILKLRC